MSKQKTYYVREDLARVMAMIASRDDRRESDVVNEALDHYIQLKLSTDEMKVFGYKKELETNGHASTVNGVGRTNGRNDRSNGERSRNGAVAPGGPPGRQKRLG